MLSFQRRPFHNQRTRADCGVTCQLLWQWQLRNCLMQASRSWIVSWAIFTASICLCPHPHDSLSLMTLMYLNFLPASLHEFPTMNLKQILYEVAPELLLISFLYFQKLVKQIIHDDPPKSDYSIKNFLGQGLVMTQGEIWKHDRRFFIPWWLILAWINLLLTDITKAAQSSLQ